MRYRPATLALALALACLAAAPAAMAQTSGAGSPTLSVDDAYGIAALNGVVAIRKIELDDGVWKVEGRDRADRRVEMKIDPHTGEIAELERFD